MKIRADKTKTPEVAALILAAGTSSRAGNANKLLHPYKHTTLLGAVVDAVVKSTVQYALVVTGHESDKVSELLQARKIPTLYCEDYKQGMAHSLATGLSALRHYSAVLVCLGDMPDVQTSTLNKLLDAAYARGCEGLTVPVFVGKRGNPVVVGAEFFEILAQHQGDSGARFLMQSYPDKVFEVAVEDAGVLQDYDELSDLSK